MGAVGAGLTGACFGTAGEGSGTGVGTCARSLAGADVAAGIATDPSVADGPRPGATTTGSSNAGTCHTSGRTAAASRTVGPAASATPRTNDRVSRLVRRPSQARMR